MFLLKVFKEFIAAKDKLVVKLNGIAQELFRNWKAVPRLRIEWCVDFGPSTVNLAANTTQSTRGLEGSFLEGRLLSKASTQLNFQEVIGQ